MREILKAIVEALVTPYAPLVAPAVASAWSKLSSGAWLGWWQELPLAAKWTIGVALAVWLTLVGIRKRNVVLRKMEDKNLRKTFVVNMHGHERIGTIRYNGLIWRIQLPRSGGILERQWKPSDVTIETPPVCPVCQTELTETTNILEFSVWRCPREQCRWKKRSTLSISHLEPKALAVAQRDLEVSLEQERAGQDQGTGA